MRNVLCGMVIVATWNLGCAAGWAGSPTCKGQCARGEAQSPCSDCYRSELHRAGYPNRISRLAVPSNSCRYAGYYVGGTTPFWRHGNARCPDEGTWGWDYWGGKFKRHISLAWLHGRDANRKFGSYRTDGPKVIEKIHALHERE